MSVLMVVGNKKENNMEELEVGRNYEIEEIMSRRDTDTNKYVFSYYQDLCWDTSDMSERDAKLIEKYYDTEDSDKFVKIINKYYGTSFKVTYVSIMKGPGAGWPEVEFINIKPMTIKEYIQTWEDENGSRSIEDFVFDLKVEDKIEKGA